MSIFHRFQLARVALALYMFGFAALAVIATGCGNEGAAQVTEDKEQKSDSDAPDDPSPDVKTDSAEETKDDSHEDAGDAKHTNRLIDETSPYLLMHAHNPVDWYPWGEEALAKAKKENKIIFLSIGYSSCHWCHVMERESFMDKEIAALLNKHFVCIKVDREERPDIDAIYMQSLQVLSQRGGWPLSMFLTPDAKPFFGGTYFPARDGDRGGGAGFLTLVTRVQEVWKDNADAIKTDADTVTKLTKQRLESANPVELFVLHKDLLDETQDALKATYDPNYGGFGYDPRNPDRPKFPEPSNLFFLVDRIDQTGDEEAKEMLVGTLERISMGGIRDHVGGGIHRYSVDRFWHIPHFEKMLYDNGQLATAYAEAYRLTKREDFRRVVDEMLQFVLREMTDPGGGFLSALDADSEHEEGKFYRWEIEEIEKLLDKDEFALFAAIYGLNGDPNFEGEYYAPQFEKPLHEIAAERKVDEAALDARLAVIRKKLFDARSKRIRPLTDDKILTSWNGLMIRGFADAGRIFENEQYVKAAEDAANFVLAKLRTKEGRLLRTYGQGKAKLNAYLNDYAFLANGLIALHRATGDEKWLKIADELTQKQIELFGDDENGGFFFTSDDHESLIARGRNPVDGAQPSGISVATENLIYLAQQLDKPDYLRLAERSIQSVAGLLEQAPHAAPRMMVAVSHLLRIKGDEEEER